ncbi:DNA-processing protein DprA [Aliarcobacter butzleri]|uniref:DNA-processing protein DprA n=1 Tax=Aliarcobacter butzleri TaxID=28197 RepID=UPI003AF62339
MCDIQTITLLALNNIKNFGVKTIIDIYREYEYVNNYTFEIASFISFLKEKRNLSEEIIEELENNINLVKYELEKEERKDIKIISFFDYKYPIQLKLLKNPPLFLFCKGNVELLSYMKNIAVVGTRENSSIGDKVAKKTSEYFSSKGYTIVSGLAKGIDTSGHIGALNANGKTIAILTDLIKIYPAENRELAQDILDNDGLLFSEIAPWRNVYRNAFVDRDRLQSGMSLGTFVIETDIKGGTMHTVKFTLEQNRYLFVPNFTKLPYDSGFPKINGTKYLANENKAMLYDKEIYPEILNMLENKESEIIKEYKLNEENSRKLL